MYTRKLTVCVWVCGRVVGGWGLGVCNHTLNLWEQRVFVVNACFVVQATSGMYIVVAAPPSRLLPHSNEPTLCRNSLFIDAFDASCNNENK